MNKTNETKLEMYDDESATLIPSATGNAEEPSKEAIEVSAEIVDHVDAIARDFYDAAQPQRASGAARSVEAIDMAIDRLRKHLDFTRRYGALNQLERDIETICEAAQPQPRKARIEERAEALRGERSEDAEGEWEPHKLFPDSKVWKERLARIGDKLKYFEGQTFTYSEVEFLYNLVIGHDNNRAPKDIAKQAVDLLAIAWHQGYDAGYQAFKKA